MTRQIVSDVLADASEETKAELPTTSSLTRTVRRTRQKKNPQLPIPSSRAELVLPEEYTQSNKGKEFLLHDSEGDRSRFLNFSTTDNLNFLSSCNIWHCDGTFKTVPRIFEQLYTIHGLKNEKTIPLVFVLLPDKRQSTFKKFLQVLKDANDSLNPEIIVVDFEKGFINAINEIIPDANIHGCNFHFGQCLNGNIQSCGLQTRYGNDEEFSINLRMLLALAYVHQVKKSYRILTKSGFFKTNEEELKNILEYFSKTWIGHHSRRGSQ